MMRYASIGNLVALCGVVLGVLVLCNTASPTVLHASDDVGGWWPVPVGHSCGGNNPGLSCGDGQTWGYMHCEGTSFNGVVPGSGGTVQPQPEHEGEHPCSYNPNSYWEVLYPGISADCGSIINTFCSTY